MSHAQDRTVPEPSRRARQRSSVRTAAIAGSAVICFVAFGLQSDAPLYARGPQTPWVMNWLAPAHGTAGLTAMGDLVASRSEGGNDAASLLVLGVSLIGGGRIIRRVRKKAAQDPDAALRTARSRPPVAAMPIGPRRIAR